MTSPVVNGSEYVYCDWELSRTGSSVRLEFVHFDLPTSQYGLCILAYVAYGGYDRHGRKVISEKVRYYNYGGEITAEEK